MKKIILAAAIGVIATFAFVAFKLVQPGSINVKINLSKADIEAMQAQFNPAASVDFSLNKNLNFKCPGSEPQTCSLSLVP